MKKHEFDTSNIDWTKLEGFDHIHYFVYEGDEENRTVDVLFKFAANEQVVLHKHRADYRTFVVQGELRIYRSDGEVKEIRPIGSYVLTRAGGEPHREGGGDQEVIALFSNRNIADNGAIYELLNDDLSTNTVLGIADFRALLEAQREKRLVGA